MGNKFWCNKRIWKNLAGFVIAASLTVWMVILLMTLIREGWGMGLIGYLGLGVLLLGTLVDAAGYVYELWKIFDVRWTKRLEDKYRRRYQPHAEDELFLRKAYDDAVSIAATLYPLVPVKFLFVRAEILYQMLEQLEGKEHADKNRTIEIENGK